MAKGSYEVAALPEVMNVCGVEIGYPLFPPHAPPPPPADSTPLLLYPLNS